MTTPAEDAAEIIGGAAFAEDPVGVIGSVVSRAAGRHAPIMAVVYMPGADRRLAAHLTKVALLLCEAAPHVARGSVLDALAAEYGIPVG